MWPRRPTMLLLSSAAGPDGAFLRYEAQAVERLLGRRETLLFVPFASVLASYDDVTSQVRQGFMNLLYDVTGLHRAADPHRAVEEASAIVIGGGNTFRLLQMLQRLELVAAIRERVVAGVPYIGWSAGANIAAPTIATTNDMPIVAPATFEALDLLPFQINPHYEEESAAACRSGESRAQRLREYCELSPSTPVAAMRDGATLRVEGASVMVGGISSVTVFAKGQQPWDVSPGEPLRPSFAADP